jgi:hypothetical protein
MKIEKNLKWHLFRLVIRSTPWDISAKWWHPMLNVRSCSNLFFKEKENQQACSTTSKCCQWHLHPQRHGEEKQGKSQAKESGFKGAARVSQQAGKILVVKLTEGLPVWEAKTWVHQQADQSAAASMSLVDLRHCEQRTPMTEEEGGIGFWSDSHRAVFRQWRCSSTGGTAENNRWSKPLGRPIGTSEANKRVWEQLENALTDEITDEHANEKKKAGTKKQENNALGKIIKWLKSKHDLECFEVPEDTIWSQFKWGNLLDVQEGHKSPMAEIEPLIVEVVKASNRARAPWRRMRS